MDIPRVSSSVRRITVFQKNASGEVRPVTVYRRGGSKKKGSALLRPLERAARRVADAQVASAQSYLSRHDKSNKKKDGWLQDLGNNVFRASQKGTKALKLNRLVPD